jgi:hypothetical protein
VAGQVVPAPVEAELADQVQDPAGLVVPGGALYERIREAALDPEESAKLLTEAADALPDN